VPKDCDEGLVVMEVDKKIGALSAQKDDGSVGRRINRVSKHVEEYKYWYS
jgi:hypothetical protein